MNQIPTSAATPIPSAPALSGIRILDLTAIVFGPYASQTLADFGAEIIKVEPPTGESTRFTGPAYEKGLSAIFLGVNRNKKKSLLRLKTARRD
jgi:Predicted acyl-CoA transferases/carnitine dehydratase